MVDRPFWLKDETGDAVITAMIAIALVGVLLMAITNGLFLFNKASGKTSRVMAIDAFYTSVIAAIENDESWKTTAIQNAGMSCVRTAGDVCASPGVARRFNAYLQDGSVLAFGDPSTGQGFDRFGNTCTGFSTTTPNDACPFAFELTWTPVCGGPCPSTVLSITNQTILVPKISINVRVLYSGTDATSASINMARFTTAFNRGEQIGTLAANCRALLGNFDVQTKKCHIQINTCPTGQLFYGFDSEGVALCRNNGFIDRACPPSFAIISVKHGGGFECGKF